MKKKNLQMLAMFFMATLIVLTACKKDDDNNNTTPTPTESTELSGNLTADRTLDATKAYTVKGYFFIEAGVTLTIPAGTLLEGFPGQAENASAIIVKMGGKIEAVGTAADPIVMTAYGDGYDGNYVKTKQGLWGGLILLGKATTNNTTAKRIEGIPDQYNAFYGLDGNAGADDADNSGTVQYVSVRHGGTDIGAGNEINGVSLGAVGSATTLDHIEVIANADDGFEFFGGDPRLSHAVVVWVGDDSFDYDEGFHGLGQFWVGVQRDGTGDRLAEMDGGTDSDEEAAPYAQPVIYNATYIGNFDGAYMIFRDNAAGTYANSIFANGAEGIRVEYRDDKHSSYNWLTDAAPAATLMIKNCLFSSIADSTVAKSFFAKAETGTLPADHATVMANAFNNNANFIEQLGIDGDNPIPVAASANPTAALPSDPFFQQAAYHGAYQPGGTNWANGWTLWLK